MVLQNTCAQQDGTATWSKKGTYQLKQAWAGPLSRVVARFRTHERPGWIGRRVQVQWDARQVRLLDPGTGQLLREHLRQTRGRHRIKEEDDLVEAIAEGTRKEFMETLTRYAC
jgi:hypothetical protein